jgi:hypothetical protein
MNSNEFRKELEKIMPGYAWTVHRPTTSGYLWAEGMQCSGFNRLSTLSVQRREQDGKVVYTAKSAGSGLRARWLHENEDGTLARALRGLQAHYEWTAAHYGKHAEDMKRGRVPTHNVAIEGPEQAQLANGPARMEGSTT